MNELREQLLAAEERLRHLRAERADVKRIFDAAKSAVAEHETDATLASATAAKESLTRIEQQIEATQDEQTTLLRRVGDAESGRSPGLAFTGADGWAEAARRLDLAQGQTHVDLAGGALLQRPMASLDIGGFDTAAASTRVPIAAPPQDRRFAYPVLRQQSIADGDLSVSGVTIQYTTTGLSGVTGIERVPTSTAEKAELDGTVGWDSADLSQFAITMDEIPVAVVNAATELRGLLQNEMSYRLNLAIDAHVITAINAAAPPTGSSGANLVEQVRIAVAASRALGANPTTLLLNPADAASLDLTTVGSDGLYLFATRASGSASPLWDLVIRESETITDPLLIDPALLGTLFVGGASVMVDPYSGMKRNVVAVRVELEALLWVRDHRGAYLIGSE